MRRRCRGKPPPGKWRRTVAMRAITHSVGYGVHLSYISSYQKAYSAKLINGDSL